MVPADQFLTKLRVMVEHRDHLIKENVEAFVQDIYSHTLYVPGDPDTYIENLLTDSARAVTAFYFVANVAINGRPKRVRLPGGLPDQISAFDLEALRVFIETCRTNLADRERRDPAVISIPCPSRAMILLTTCRQGNVDNPEMFLLLDPSLDPLAGLQLLHSSITFWRDTSPADPMFFGDYPLQ